MASCMGRSLVHSGRFLGFLLIFGIILAQVHQSEAQTTSCNCRPEMTWSIYLPGIRCDSIICDSTNTGEEVNCAKMYITKNDQGKSIVKLSNSDFDQFQNEFALPVNIKEMIFQNCEMAGIPNEIIKSACPSLALIWFHNCYLRIKNIPSKAFENCKKIQEIRITYSGIETVSKYAFAELVNLRRLNFNGNSLKTFGGFDGIPNLVELNLNYNGINFIERNSFHGLYKLTTLHLQKNHLRTLEEGVFDPFLHNQGLRIFLRENPFYCTCALKRLHDWLRLSAPRQFIDYLDIEPQCAEPVIGKLRLINVCDTMAPMYKDSSSPFPDLSFSLFLSSCILQIASLSTPFTY